MRTARHLASSPRGHRRRWLGVPLVGWLVLATAGAALAAWLVTQTTAPSSFTTQGAGTLSIGNAATDPLFSLGNLQPGDSQTNCMQGSWASAPSNPVLKLYSAGVAGTGLADHLQVVIHTGTFSGNTVGVQSCSTFTPDATPLFSGTLAAYGAAHTSYATGHPLTLKTLSGVRYAGVRVQVTLPDTPTVQQQAGGKTATISWTLEGQGS